MKLSGKEITLRPFTLDDIATHLANDDEQQAKWMDGKRTEQSTRNWINRCEENWRDDGPVYTFAVTKNNGELIGEIDANIDCEELDSVNEGEANVSYSIYPKFRGQGYAGKAVSLMERFLLSKNISKSVIRISPENISSLKVPEKLGYSNEGKIISRDGDELIIFVKALKG